MRKLFGTWRFMKDPPTSGDLTFQHFFVIESLEDEDDEEGTGIEIIRTSRYELYGTSRLLLVEVAAFMIDDNAAAALLRNAFLNCYFGSAQQTIPGLRYGAQVKSSIETCTLEGVEIDRYSEQGIIDRKEREHRGTARRALRTAKVNPAALFAPNDKQATWRPRKGETAVLSYLDKKDKDGRPIPAHVVRFEIRSVGGKRKLVGIERRYKARRTAKGDYVAITKPGGKWITRPKTKTHAR